MTDQTQPKNHPAKGAAIAVAIAGAVALATPFTTVKEGTVTHAYRDPVGIGTYCTGETQGVDWKRTYTRAECAGLLQQRMTRDYAEPLIACAPGIEHNIPALAALTDLAYNIGSRRACRSPIAQHFKRGEWSKGCDAFVGYYVTARGIPLRGLVERRKGERDICRKGLT